MISITTVAAKSYEKCDINKDGTVDVSDAVLYLRYVSKDETLSLQYVPVDVTGDGETSIADVVYISLIIAKYDPDDPPQKYDYRTMTTETTTETTETTTETTETTTTMSTPPIPWLPTSQKTTTTVTQYAGDSDTFFTEVIADFPKKDDLPVYAYKDSDGTVWFFTISGDAQYRLLLDPTKIEKVNRWTPTEEELSQYVEKFGNIPDFEDDYPPKTAFKVPNSSKIRAYDLVDWDKIDASLIEGAVKYLMSGKSTGETKIATMDFNQNTKVDTSDVVIMIRYYVINIGLSDK